MKDYSQNRRLELAIPHWLSSQRCLRPGALTETRFVVHRERTPAANRRPRNPLSDLSHWRHRLAADKCPSYPGHDSRRRRIGHQAKAWERTPDLTGKSTDEN